MCRGDVFNVVRTRANSQRCYQCTSSIFTCSFFFFPLDAMVIRARKCSVFCTPTGSRVVQSAFACNLSLVYQRRDAAPVGRRHPATSRVCLLLHVLRGTYSWNNRPIKNFEIVSPLFASARPLVRGKQEKGLWTCQPVYVFFWVLFNFILHFCLLFFLLLLFPVVKFIVECFVFNSSIVFAL